MRVFHQLSEISGQWPASCLAIGNFDGIHIGHQTLLKQMVARAKAEGVPSVVLTFFPHPIEVLSPSKQVARLSTTSEKLELIESMGVQNVLVEPFNLNLAKKTADDFFNSYLLNGIKAKSIHIGQDFCFGKDRVGNIAYLENKTKENGLHLNIVSPFMFEGEKASSSSIRNLIIEGQVEKATELLGRHYSISGVVKHGDKRGSLIGFPTANLYLPLEKALPQNGVYITKTHWQKQEFISVSNVGVRPTFELKDNRKILENHILDFNQKIYDETLKVSFVKMLREEKKFGSVQMLIDQIKMDVETTREYFK